MDGTTIRFLNIYGVTGGNANNEAAEVTDSIIDGLMECITRDRAEDEDGEAKTKRSKAGVDVSSGEASRAGEDGTRRFVRSCGLSWHAW